MKNPSTEKRIYIIDVLKVVSCFFVFRIHMGGDYYPFVSLAVPIFVFITGYNYAQSCYIKNSLTIKDWFLPKNLLKKILRLYIPYLVFALCQIILVFALKADYKTGNAILAFFVGGYGPGNYYLLLMIQIIAIFPFLFHFTKIRPMLTLTVCLAFYLCYHLVMRFAFPDGCEDVTSLGGAINKWAVFRWIFLIDCGIYFYIEREKIKWWHLALLIPVDLIPLILQLTTNLPPVYPCGIPYYFIAFALVGISIKYLGNISFGKLEKVIAYCGKATWHVFLFQQLYFWLIDLLNWEIGFTYLSFPICFFGGIAFFTVQFVIQKIIKAKRSKNV